MNALTTIAKIPPEHLDLLLKNFYERKSKKTITTYQEGLKSFSDFLELPSNDATINHLLNNGQLHANLVVAKFRNFLIGKGLKANTINIRLCAIRAMLVLANKLGVVPWTLVIEDQKRVKYRDTRGPGTDDVAKLLNAAQEQSNIFAAKRDLAMLSLMIYCGFRKDEVRMIDVADVNLSRKAVMIVRKGRTDKEVKTLPAYCVGALTQWLAVRGNDEGAVFINERDRKRLSSNGVWKIVTVLSRDKAKIGHVYPHKLRHTAINEAFEINPSARDVQQFSGHMDLQTLTIYDDHRHDVAGDIASKIADKIEKKRDELREKPEGPGGGTPLPPP